MKVVVTGGGTGGHLYPALAVVEALKADSQVQAITYIGNTGRKEAELVPTFGVPFIGMRFAGMPRGLNLSIVPWSMQLLQAFFDARSHLMRLKPDVVFGTGGYITGPVLFAARSLGIPYVVHEPDAFPGLVNRVTARWATQMTCAFPEARARLKTRQLTVSGNPLRSQIGQVSKAEALARLDLPFALDKPILLVTGGSQGARKLNQGLLEALPELIESLGMQVLHQTGDKLYEEVLSQCPPEYRTHQAYACRPFISDMASALALADVAVSRSGSMSLSEMYRAHIPTILVPYPHAAADHQRKNALASARAGASVMIEDAQLSGETLIDTLADLLRSPERLEAMREAARQLSAPEATSIVVGILKSVALTRPKASG